MATRRGKSPADSLEETVATKLPGWHIETQERSDIDALHDESTFQPEAGVTAADLERKFLGTTTLKNSPSDAMMERAEKRAKYSQTVRVKPDDGGPSKVADIDMTTQEVKIVQG
jgi:hypothetical protein